MPDDDGNPLAWQSDSLCAQTDPEAFFPEKGGSTRDAKRICESCDVRRQCLEYALANDERFGVWGGLSERERRKLRQVAREPLPVRTHGTERMYSRGGCRDEESCPGGVDGVTCAQANREYRRGLAARRLQRKGHAA